MSKVIVDALGSDAGPEMVADALADALGKESFSAVFVGPRSVYESKLSSCSSRVELLETDTFIENTEAPVIAIRRKKDSSLVLGLHRLNQDGDVFVTAGSTGALLAGAYFITKRLEGIDRCCLCVSLPAQGGEVLIADTGATVDASPGVLLQFAKMTSAYARFALKKENPSVALLNVGTEEEKGDKRSKEAYQLLAQSSLNFTGNVEARSILEGPCDIIITDGFAGNVAVKGIEGTASFLFHKIKEAAYSSLSSKIGAFLMKGALKDLLKTYDYRAHGGAPLLGARKALYKAHGNSNAETFSLAIREALHYADSNMLDKLKKEMEDESSRNHGQN